MQHQTTKGVERVRMVFMPEHIKTDEVSQCTSLPITLYWSRMENSTAHIPVLCNEMVQALAPYSGGVYLDGTLGSGGYTEALLKASSPEGRVIGLDIDAHAVEKNRQRFAQYGRRVVFVHAGFHETASILEKLGIPGIDGAVLDLGLSSEQLDDPNRGFSFRQSGPLDMRFDTSSGKTALEYLRDLSPYQLEEILATYGEERYCKKLARALSRAAAHGELNTTGDVVRCVEALLSRRRGKIHPATRVFQALRIVVNKEIEHLRTALGEIPRLLVPGSRFCVVCYHSLEDREVKIRFQELGRRGEAWRIVTPKPVRPSAGEIAGNPRARSARMRVIELVKQEHREEAARH